MNVKSVEKKEKSAVELVIQVSAEEFESAIDKVYKRQRGKISVPGFRKGHAPRKIIEGMYGAGVFYEDAINDAYPAAYSAAVEQEKLDVVAYPDIEIQDAGKDGFTFKATVTVRPPVKLGEYKGLTAPKDTVSVSEADIDGEMKPFLDRATRLVSVERWAKEGDTVVIDFEGFDQGVPFEGGKAEGYSLELGSHSFVPGFEEQLVGMKEGEEKDLDITFPEDYHADLAGKPVVFHVKVCEVKEKQLPAVDDEFAKDVSEFETLADFRKDLGEKLKQRREAQAKSAFENAIMEQVISNMEVEIPDAMVQARAEQMMEDYARRVTSQGIPFENYLQMMGMSKAAFQEQATEGALQQIRRELAVGAVAEAEKLEISEEEKQAEYDRLAGEYGMKSEQVKAAIGEEDLVRDLKMKKAETLIYESAKAGKGTKKAEKTEKKAEKKTEKKTEKAGKDEEKTAKKTEKKTEKTEKKTEKKTAKAEKPADEEKPKKTTRKSAKKTEE